MGSPSHRMNGPYREVLDKGFDFIASKVQSDGGIYGKGLFFLQYFNLHDGFFSQSKDRNLTGSLRTPESFW